MRRFQVQHGITFLSLIVVDRAHGNPELEILIKQERERRGADIFSNSILVIKLIVVS